MKKLFVIGFLLTTFLILLGCQSDSPVTPDLQDNELEKGRQMQFTGELIPSTDNPGFLNISVSWSPVRGAAFYFVTFFNLKIGTLHTYELPATETSFVIEDEAMLQINGKTCDVTVQAVKERKGELVVFASGTQTFTYTGTGLQEIIIDGYLAQFFDYTTTVHLANWSPAGYVYYGYITPSYSTLFREDFGPIFSPDFNSQTYARDITHPDNIGDYYTVIMKGYDSGVLTAIGYLKAVYTP